MKINFLLASLVQNQADVNLSHLKGRIASDVELEHTKNNYPVISFKIATNPETPEDGKKAQFHRVVAYGNEALRLAGEAVKGQVIAVEGAWEHRTYKDKLSGETKYFSEMIVSDFLLGAKPREKIPVGGVISPVTALQKSAN